MFMHISELGDCIGEESCVDLKPADVVDDYDVGAGWSGGSGNSSGDVTRRKGKEVVETVPTVGRGFPPQISSLARAENLQAPWVMRKYYTDDGRLVITEEKVRRHEYFRTHRSDGRLVMSFIPVEDDDEEDDDADDSGGGVEGGDEEEAADCGEENAAASVHIEEGSSSGNDGEVDPTVEEGLSEQCKYNEMGVNVRCGGLALAVGGGCDT